jgi:hypothetical protein
MSQENVPLLKPIMPHFRPIAPQNVPFTSDNVTVPSNSMWVCFSLNEKRKSVPDGSTSTSMSPKSMNAQLTPTNEYSFHSKKKKKTTTNVPLLSPIEKKEIHLKDPVEIETTTINTTATTITTTTTPTTTTTTISSSSSSSSSSNLNIAVDIKEIKEEKENIQSQQSATSTSTSFSKKPSPTTFLQKKKAADLPIRSGRWKTEEEMYLSKLVYVFRNGMIEDLVDGTSMRSWLATILNCCPMRISKKQAAGAKVIGKKKYVRFHTRIEMMSWEKYFALKKELYLARAFFLRLRLEEYLSSSSHSQQNHSIKKQNKTKQEIENWYQRLLYACPLPSIIQKTKTITTTKITTTTTKIQEQEQEQEQDCTNTMNNTSTDILLPPIDTIDALVEITTRNDKEKQIEIEIEMDKNKKQKQSSSFFSSCFFLSEEEYQYDEFTHPLAAQHAIASVLLSLKKAKWKEEL